MLHAENVTVTAGRRHLVDDVSIAVKPGRLLAILGPNGAGKSTLLSLLSGERVPHRGRVRLDEQDLSSFSSGTLACRRAVVAQNPAATFAFSVEEVMTLASEIAPLGLAERRQMIAEALSQADAEGVRHQVLPHLSGGERQRVAFARALVQLAAGRKGLALKGQMPGRSYLLLDEPTASLDPAHQHDLLRAARRWVAQSGGACAVVLHDLTLAARYCDDGLLLAGGREAWSGAMTDLPVPVLERVFGTGFARLAAPNGLGWVYVATGTENPPVPEQLPAGLSQVA